VPHFSSDNLRSIIAEGESVTVELKARLPAESILARTLSAFANSYGGVLIIGATGQGNIVGLSPENANAGLARVRAVGDSLLPAPIDAGIVELEGKQVVYASTPSADENSRPVMTSDGHIFQRQGSRNYQLGEPEEMDLLRKRPRPVATPKECVVFVAMSFRDEEEPALVDYYRAMERAVSRSELPLKLVRVDREEGDYEISQQLMRQIDDADIVIADYTMSPHNVYFEAGYARGRRKRVIQIARKDESLQFDVRNWRTEVYRNATELEDKLVPALQAAYGELTEQ
jgi:Schlafen, AlbA_2